MTLQEAQKELDILCNVTEGQIIDLPRAASHRHHPKRSRERGVEVSIVTTQEIHREGCPVRYYAIIDGVILKTPSGQPYAYTTEKMAIKNAAIALAMGWEPDETTYS